MDTHLELAIFDGCGGTSNKFNMEIFTKQIYDVKIWNETPKMVIPNDDTFNLKWYEYLWMTVFTIIVVLPWIIVGAIILVIPFVLLITSLFL